MSEALDKLRRSALALVIIGLAWNLVEAAIAGFATIQSGSVALLAFGLDSIVELIAGGILIWHLKSEQNQQEDHESTEKRAQKLLGITFFILAAYIAIHSSANLIGWLPQPQPSPLGITIIVASAIVMTTLYIAKMRIAVRMQSWSLRAEAMETLFCDIQDLAILIGLALNALLAWWWADPVASWILIPFLINEGRENLSGHDHHEDNDESIIRRVCFEINCLYGLIKCRAACCTT